MSTLKRTRPTRHTKKPESLIPPLPTRKKQRSSRPARTNLVHSESDDSEFEVEAIIDRRVHRNKTQYLVK